MKFFGGICDGEDVEVGDSVQTFGFPKRRVDPITLDKPGATILAEPGAFYRMIVYQRDGDVMRFSHCTEWVWVPFDH